MTLRGVEEVSFQNIIKYGDARAPKPTRALVRKHMDLTEENLRGNIKELLTKAGKISFTTGNSINKCRKVPLDFQVYLLARRSDRSLTTGFDLSAIL